jgi:DNA-binding transcriptional ArsR family regulator
MSAAPEISSPSNPTTFRARWRVIAACAALSTAERQILSAMADHIVHEEEVFCGIPRLSSMTGLSARAIHGHLKTLERMGALAVSRSTGRANRYRIQWAWLLSADQTSADSAPVQNLRQRRSGVKPAQISSSTSAESAPEVIEEIEVNSPPPTTEVALAEEDTRTSAQPVSSPVDNPSSVADAASPGEEGIPGLDRPFTEQPYRIPERIGRPLYDAGLRTWGDLAAMTRDGLKVLGAWERDIKGNLDLIESFLSKACPGATLRASTYDAPGAVSEGSVGADGAVAAGGRLLSRLEVERRAQADWALVDAAVRKWGRMRPPRLREGDMRERWHFGDDPAAHERILAVMDRAALSWLDLCNANTFEEEVQRKRFTLAWPAGIEVAA